MAPMPLVIESCRKPAVLENTRTLYGIACAINGRKQNKQKRAARVLSPTKSPVVRLRREIMAMRQRQFICSSLHNLNANAETCNAIYGHLARHRPDSSSDCEGRLQSVTVNDL